MQLLKICFSSVLSSHLLKWIEIGLRRSILNHKMISQQPAWNFKAFQVKSYFIIMPWQCSVHLEPPDFHQRILFDMWLFVHQGHGKLLWLMQGMFRTNGECGYVKKPDFLMKTGPHNEVFNPKRTSIVKKTLKVRIIFWLRKECLA